MLVADFLLDDENIAKFWSHGLSAEQVRQVLDNPFTVIPNRKNRRASYLIIGRDWNGQCITIPIESTYDAILWRPVTAWRCKASEAARLPQRR
jgi:hypothetical protein